MANPTFTMVSLELHGVGKYRRINSVIHSARCLMKHWPKDKQHDDAFVAALLACQAAIDGGGPSAQTVRVAVAFKASQRLPA